MHNSTGVPTAERIKMDVVRESTTVRSLLTFVVYILCKLGSYPLVEPSAYHVASREIDHSWASGSDS
jgi:hypothetical protein